MTVRSSRRLTIGAAMFVLVAAAMSGCGGGDSSTPMPVTPPVNHEPASGRLTVDGTGGMPTVKEQRLPVPFRTCTDASCPHYDIGDLPIQTAADALQMPVYQTRPSASTPPKLFVGVHRSGSASSVAGVRNGFDIRHGRVDDGAGADRVAEYLRQTAQVDLAGYRQLTPDTVLPEVGDIVRYGVPPVVLYGGQPDARDVDHLVRTIQLVNAALPANWKLRMPTDAPVDCTQCRNIGYTTLEDWKLRLPPGVSEPTSFIYVEFIPGSEWNMGAPANADVWSLPSNRTSVQYNADAPVFDHDRTAVTVLAHEILHALGVRGSDRLYGHIDPSFDSIMTSDGGAAYDTSRLPLSLLYPADREALRVRYERLQHGEPLTDFGPWESASRHVSGNGRHAGFGVAWRNGYGEPWAHGYLPDSDLTDNPALQGTATWSGVLLGFTPEAATVAGDAVVGVNLADLTGRADFTGLESWADSAAPGDPGTGATWGDGDLAYSILVTGNTFRQTGGDDGFLTGIFTGAAHEGMGGALERDDLTAAFGGQR